MNPTNPPFDNDAAAIQDLEDDEMEHGPLLFFLLLFDELPVIDHATIARGLAASGALRVPLTITDQVTDGDTPHATINFDDHTLILIAYDEPAPENMTEQAINCSNWQQPDKMPLRRHKAHMFCSYIIGSDDPTERMIAMLRLTGAFLKSGLLGYTDPDAWTCMPAKFLQKNLKAKMLADCREQIPLGIWNGFVKMFKTRDDIWFCSKGFHRWGVPDFAFEGHLAQAEEAFELFQGLFNYVLSSGALLAVGHTAQFGNDLLRFGPITEYEEQLQTPLGTLVIEKTSRAQLH